MYTLDEDDRDVCEHEGHSRDETTENESDRESVGAYGEIGAEESETESSETESVHSHSTIPEYTQLAGCSAPLEGQSPMDYLSLLVTDDMLYHIVEQTNLSAEQYINTHELAPHSRVRRWSKAVHNINELRQFLAIIIVMGLVRYPQIEHHWATQWPYSNTHFSTVSYLHDCV